MELWLKRIVMWALLTLVAVFCWHSFASINEDIGRHIKLGEIIVTSHHIPTTNLFSFVEYSHPFLNHHWLSEVIFYLLHGAVGLQGLMIVKVFILVIVFALCIYAVSLRNILTTVVITLLSLSLLFDRTEVRPELFSYLFLAGFLYILFRARNNELSSKMLWVLPCIELIWVNAHIYFFVGLAIYGAFFLDRIIQHKFSKTYLYIGLVLGLATLVNPHGIYGALYPFNVFKEYGYDIVENKSLGFIVHYLGYWTFSIKAYAVGVVLLIASFALHIRRYRSYTFEMLISLFAVVVGYIMLRNLALFALIIVPVVLRNTSDVRWRLSRTVRVAGLVVLVCILLGSIFGITTNAFYGAMNSPKTFGLAMPSGAERGVQFIKDNHIQGNVFNNFDIGSYLIWKLYPEQKIFADGRPEAYSVDFWQKIYKPMQADPNVWKIAQDTYHINYIFFAHTDQTEWARAFMNSINKDPQWVMVYVNESVIIYVKNIPANQVVIQKYRITEEIAISQVPEILKKASSSSTAPYRALAGYFYLLGWYKPAITTFSELAKTFPDSPVGYEGQARIYILSGTLEGQKAGVPLMEKAIALGAESVENYTLLAVGRGNTNDFLGARIAIDKALALDPKNTTALQIRQKLDSIR